MLIMQLLITLQNMYSNKKDKKLFVKLLWVSYFEKEEDGREQSYQKIIPSGSNNWGHAKSASVASQW